MSELIKFFFTHQIKFSSAGSILDNPPLAVIPEDPDDPEGPDNPHDPDDPEGPDNAHDPNDDIPYGVQPVELPRNINNWRWDEPLLH